MTNDPGDETRMDYLTRMSEAGQDLHGYPAPPVGHEGPVALDDDPYAALRDAYDESEPDERDQEIAWLRAELVEANCCAEFWYQRAYRYPQPLSASWHHLPCVTMGLTYKHKSEGFPSRALRYGVIAPR